MFKFLVCFLVFIYYYNAKAFDDIYELINAENTSVFTERLAAGFDIDDQDLEGNTPLMTAAALNKPKFVAYLLDMGAKVDLRNYSGATALHKAALAGNNEVIDILMDNGAEINLPDLDGFTPLMLATSTEKRFTVELLVHRGALISFKNSKGLSALDIARKKRYAKILAFLEKEVKKIKKEEKKPNYSWDID